MDAYVSRKRRRVSVQDETNGLKSKAEVHEEQTTDEKLAILSSVFEKVPYEELLEALLAHDGSIERALESLLDNPSSSSHSPPPLKKTSAMNRVQSFLHFAEQSQSEQTNKDGNALKTVPKPLTKKGKTLYLYSPPAIAQHTPCTIIHNFLPPSLANALLQELLPEAESFTSATFRLFDNVVKSPHTASFYVDSLAEASYQKSSYLYNGSTLTDVREILPVMRQVSALVKEAVNSEIEKRIKEHYPDGKKLKYQSPGPWIPNAAFVNCYNGAQQSVGYHTDQLSYLGPHPVIGSLSLGVQREFRIRRIVPRPNSENPTQKELDELADAQGQISLPLPHNSLLVMHAEMQETWKHSIAPAGASTGGITPHPIAGNKRINITYRWYREEFSPEYTPKCKCGVPCVLKSVLRRAKTVGRYVWMCQTPGRVEAESGEGVRGTEGKEGKGCGHFEWAEFDDDGVPMWLSEQRRGGKENDLEEEKLPADENTIHAAPETATG
ncbi:hypothetical protein H2198_007822 [Neophaeococcomyces mojaviensis]|uniref:Uncharacterized protein n=1 Tax=Neophaeococcomyces mojaviensis TaxID=3383035 RepID=A0ACC2ZZ13_9EURO|nr:hypothetical protein H2198_007822 [Knufia sp. JES_112]